MDMDVKNIQYNETIYEKINKWTQEVTETQDAFIFHVLSDFASINYNITVEKDELIKAIQLIRMMRDHGEDICKDWDTAVKHSEFYRKAYSKGFEDGVNKEHDRIMDILKQREERLDE